MSGETHDVPVRAPGWDRSRPLAETDFDSLAALPEGWQYGAGLTFDEEEYRKTDALSFDSSSSSGGRAPATVERLGSARHPRIFLRTEEERFAELYGGRLVRHRCERVVYTFSMAVPDDATELRETALDLDRGADGIRSVQVVGTREGDSARLSQRRGVAGDGGPADADLQLVNAGTIVLTIESEDEIPELFRWWGTGCLACGEGGGSR